jgi:hypothetical protein
MANDASSITVLGNGRATDLSQTPGRAIWREGADQYEVQVPYLSPESVESWLADFRTDEKPKDKSEVTATGQQDAAERVVVTKKGEGNVTVP